jgi:DNA-binding NarL/FixJ family response regulator
MGVQVALVGTEFELVGEAASGAALVPLVSQLEPDLVLLERWLPERDGLSCLPLLRERQPDLVAVVLTADDSVLSIERALAAGASGFVSKQIPPRELPAALRAILEREQQVFGSLHHDDAAARARELGLSSREFEILTAIARGETNRAIARALCLTEQTIKFHLTNLYRKTGARNRTEASRYALKHGLVDNPLLAALGPIAAPRLRGLAGGGHTGEQR